MAKTLLNKIGKKVRNGALIATACLGLSLGVAGCKPGYVPDDETPAIVLEDVNVTQGESRTVNLSDLAQDSGVTWTGVAEYNPDVLTPTLEGENLTVKVSDNITEDIPYSVRLKAMNGGKEETVKLEGIVKNIVEVSGVLQNNETGTNQAGILKLFDSTGSKAGEYYTSNGNFKIVSDFSEGNMKLQARLNDGYVRTMNVPLAGKDISNILVRAVPYVNFDIDDNGSVNEVDNQKFIDWMKQINTVCSVEEENGNFFDVHLITKWNLNNLNTIEICRTNYEKGISFSQEAIDNLLGYLADADNIPKFIAGKKNLSSIVQIVESTADAHIKQPGYITVIPDDAYGTHGGTGSEETGYNPNVWGEVSSSLIRTIQLNSLLISPHEFGHSFIAQELWNESVHVISPNNTMMYSGVEHPSKPGLADEKAGKLLYEETYHAGEKIENILAQSFSDGSY
jgi:hypothetical protein